MCPIVAILTNLLLFLLTAAIFLVFYFKWQFKYWSRRGVPTLPPRFPYGHLTGGKKELGTCLKDIYDQAKPLGWKHTGFYFFGSPWYFPLDTEYIRNVMAKDFQHFVERGLYHNVRDDPLTGHLFLLGGLKWRTLRTKLTPTFTSGKMRMMFGTLVECEKQLEQKMKVLEATGEALDIKEVLGCFTTDIIASCAFGLDCNTMEHEDSPFRKHLKAVFTAGIGNLFKRTLITVTPDLARKLHVTSIPKDTSRFILDVVKDTVEHREKNNVSRKDFLQLLIELRDSFTLEEIAAQSFVFFLAGFETSSTTMTFALYELAKNPEIQTKARNEIVEVLRKYNGEITYEAVQELTYLGQVIDETLRKYPPLSFLTRECVQDYKVPGEETVVEKGTKVLIPVLALHYDPEYWPEPERFDPGRFSEANKHTIKSFTYMPFGEGPRLCIGMRFGLMQTKIGLMSLLKSYQFTVNSKTQQPLDFKKLSFVLAAEGEIWLDAKKIV